jgi:glycosyltransferase involved in cell wall biosynthesis
MKRHLETHGAQLVDLSIPNRFLSMGLRRAWAHLGAPTPLLMAGRVDVVHSVDDISVPRVHRSPLVVTCQDLSALRRPDLVGQRLVRLKRSSYRRAAEWSAVVVPSLATGEEVSELTKAPVHVVRLVVDDIWRTDPTGPARSRITELLHDAPYVVCVGPVSLKKGSDLLRDAWKLVAARLPAARLIWVTLGRHEMRGVLAGPSSAGVASPNEWVARADGIIEVRSLTDEDLVALVAGAAATVVPSRYEGFSYPIAEAAAQGTPVVATDIAPHREFELAGLELVPVEDAGALSEALDGVLRSRPRFPPVREKRTLDDVAAETAAVYTAVAE